MKLIIQEALKENIMQGDVIEVMWELDKERKIRMLDDEHFIVGNII